MKIINEVEPWDIAEEIGKDDWEIVRSIIIGCCDEHKEGTFNHIVEEGIKSTGNGSGYYTMAEAENYIISNADEIVKKLNFKREY